MSRALTVPARVLDALSVLRDESAGFVSWWLQELREVGEALLVRVAPKIARDARGVAVLDTRDVLVNEITLPIAVEREIDRALDLYLERELPLARERVCVDYHVLERDRANRRLVVRVLIAHRDKVEHLRDGMIEKGLRPVRVAASLPSGELIGNLLPRRNRTFRLTALDRRLATLASSLVIVAALVTGGQWLYERSQLEGEVERARELASSTESLARQLSGESAGAVALIGIMKTPDAADVLASLTSSVPQDAWAFELEVKPAQSGGYQVKLGGFAPAATTLVDSLEKAPRFDQVRLVTATSAGLGTSRDRLQLTARFGEP